MGELAARIVRATDNSVHQWLPARVATPKTVEAVVRLVADNNDQPNPMAVVARGGGTSTNGQCLTDGLVIDTRQYLHRIIDIDPDARWAVVEPGVVAGHLDAMLAEHGLFWAPHTSTRNRATVGGMIATDAAGKGSLVHGRTNRHVESVDVVLADATVWTARALTLAEAKVEAARPGRIGEIWSALLALETAGPFDLPELARGFSGYGISRVHHEGLVDPIPVLCGAEGTLGIVVRATLVLTPIPNETTLIVAAYPSLDAALRDAVELAGHGAARPPIGPSAIEVSDRVTLDRGAASPAWPSLRPHVPHGTEAILLCEYDVAASSEALASITESLVTSGRASSHSLITDGGERSAIWKVRADAVGLLANVEHAAPRPTAFVEDCAVPVADLPEFIAGFRAILDGYGLDYAMFGHADVGCVHVRPALDPISADHEALIAVITADVLELLDQFGGILWGEHGRGLRSAVVDSVLSPELIHQMRLLKSAFDPLDVMNPGKLYRPVDSDQLLIGLDDVPRRAGFDRAVPVSIRRDFSHAFDCNGNGLCHHHGDNEVMCPSYKITADPVQAPKGRTDLIRAWLHAEQNAEGQGGEGDEAIADAVAESLSSCLSCGACTGHCPVQVDIPELKSRFFESYYQTRRRPFRDQVLSRLETIVPLLQDVPGRNSSMAAWFARGIGLVDLPSIPRSVKTDDLRVFDPEDIDLDVVVLADVFTSVLDRDELIAAVGVLESLGYRTAVSRLVPTAKFDHVKGLRKRFARAARRQRVLLEQIEHAGAVAVSLDPALALMHRHDYAKVDPTYPTAAVRPLVELVVDRLDRLSKTSAPVTIDLFGHCTEQALAPKWIDQWASVLSAAGHDVRRVATGCCGMAGVFGHEAENADLSHALFEQLWRPHLARAENESTTPESTMPGSTMPGSTMPESRTAVATGWSCRSQAERHGQHVLSPIVVLAAGRYSPASRLQA